MQKKMQDKGYFFSGNHSFTMNQLCNGIIYMGQGSKLGKYMADL